MNVNRKFDRFKQWAGERMGGEVKTNVSDDFKQLEEEMTCRHEGMERLHKSMTSYIKSISKTKEAEEKDRSLPVAYLGSSMIAHGEQFDRGSIFGACLISMGRTNERIARTQESYIAKATTSWLESLERSLAQMKEYQAARKKLEARRLAYDASLSKMQKAKREDFRVEEELRAQKAKYEESSEDVFRRMQDIKEAESESITDLGVFLEAELEYHDRCRDILLKLKNEWPAAQESYAGFDERRGDAGYGPEPYTLGTPYDSLPSRPPMASRPGSSVRAGKTAAVMPDPTRREHPDSHAWASTRAPRTPSGGAPPAASRSQTPIGGVRPSRIPSDPVGLANPHARAPLRPFHRINTNPEHFPPDASDESAVSNSSPERSCDELPESPTTSYGSISSRVGSTTTLHSGVSGGKRAGPPPPPPPSRSKKPPPPPPPMKRSTLSTTSVPHV